MIEQTKILCVDDEENVLRALKRLFFEDSYEIITASSGHEGLKILEREDAQIVISDYRMPEMSGVDFLREVCRRKPDTVRIVLSGYADIASIVSAINEGQIYKFIPKPWNDAELKVTVANAVERYFLYKRNSELSSELEKKNEELVRVNFELKRMLERETANLQFQSKVLTRQQSILDLLPVGILGIDFSDTVVMCNSRSSDITKNSQFPLDQDIKDIVPEKVLQFAEDLKLKKKAAETMELYGHKGRLMGTMIEHDEFQKGLILIFIREDDPI